MLCREQPLPWHQIWWDELLQVDKIVSSIAIETYTCLMVNVGRLRQRVGSWECYHPLVMKGPSKCCRPLADSIAWYLFPRCEVCCHPRVSWGPDLIISANVLVKIIRNSIVRMKGQNEVVYILREMTTCFDCFPKGHAPADFSSKNVLPSGGGRAHVYSPACFLTPVHKMTSGRNNCVA